MALHDNLEELKDWTGSITNTIFIIAATVTGLMVAAKFISSRDKKEAMSYAIWWIVGIFFFFVCSSIISEIMDMFGNQ
ncbi:hypothetical protein [Cardinium endosymbiont of Nabis limbatus]|uniref:hypothetical protein n=1 Tax=Cardinium endosymbiont of Nabis limbatus TaxID=3066217 RepID=UPI003AF348F7